MEFEGAYFVFVQGVADAFGKDRNEITFDSIVEGSIVVTGETSIKPSESATEASSRVKTSLGGTHLAGLPIQSSSTTEDGFTSDESDDDSRLGLILGVSIPVGIICNF